MARRSRLIRDFTAGQYLDLFFVSAIVAVLAIRFYLHVTGYPQLGSGTLHIAHMLWGGLLMLVALVLLLSVAGRSANGIAALLGGLGWGTFIDEVGKFITRDNDYFYRPAIALIYVTFVLTYIVIRSIHRERTATPEEYLVNALQEIEQIALDDLDDEERTRALAYLQRADPRDPLVVALSSVFERAPARPAGAPSAHVRAWRWTLAQYRRVASLPGFGRATIVFFVAQLAVKVLGLVLLAATGGIPSLLAIPALRAASDEPAFVAIALVGSTVLSALFVGVGIVRMRESRLHAFRMFQRATLVSILVGQVFMFYRHELTALLGLTFDLSVFLILRFLIEREALDGRVKKSGSDRPRTTDGARSPAPGGPP